MKAQDVELRLKTWFLMLVIQIISNGVLGLSYLPINTMVRVLPHIQRFQGLPMVNHQTQRNPDSEGQLINDDPTNVPGGPVVYKLQSGYYNEILVIPGRDERVPWNLVFTNPPALGDPATVSTAVSDQVPLLSLDENRNTPSVGGEQPLDPLFLTREDHCSHFSHEGRCYRRNTCQQKKGRLTNYCRDFSKFCCIFFINCQETTDEEVVHFRNPGWPGQESYRGTCQITLKKKNNDICFFRISPRKLILPASIGYCQDIAFEAIVKGKNYEPLCGRLTDESYTVDVMGVREFTLQMRADVAARLMWEITVTQIPCSQTPGRTWPEKGAVQESPSQTGPVPEEGSPPSAPKGSRPKINTAVCGRSKKVPSSGALRVTPVLEDQGENETLGDNPFLKSLEWGVPTVNESVLYAYAFSGGHPGVSGRVTYGERTQPHEFPWSIAMYRNGRYHCGGSLITTKHVLSAAHCLVRDRARPSRISMTIGDWNINSNADGVGVTRTAQKIITHPGYSKATLKYDVGVITMNEAVVFSDTISPVCLPVEDKNLDGKLMTVSGWGRNEHNKLQPVLMKHSAAIVTNKVCGDRWKAKGAPANLIANTMICMDPQFGDSCKGDSGGPAVIEEPSGSRKFTQHGIVSFGSASCIDTKLPGVYTKVSLVGGWIREQIV